MKRFAATLLAFVLAAVVAAPISASPREPRLAFSTFLGSLGDEVATGVALDAEGNAYVVGQTDSTSFPVVGALQPASAGGRDVFVAKIAADGSGILWSTYLGGSADDVGTGIAVDAAGCAYVTGQTYSKNFPTTPGAFDDDNGRFLQCAGADCLDSFVAKIAADGSSLVYSTYLGGEHDDYAYGIAVDADGHALITGATNSFGFPRVNAFDPEKRQGTEAFVTKMAADGRSVVFSSYIGGNRGDAGFAVAAASDGGVVVAGDTLSTDFVTKDALQPQNASAGDPNGAVDAFLTKVDAAGVLVFSTYLGGRGRDLARAVAAAPNGDIIIAGETASSDFPTLAPAQATLAGGIDAFVARVRGDGAALETSTFLGGSRDEAVAGIAVTADGSAAVAGSTRSADFPTAGAVQPSCGSCTGPGFFPDAFVSVLPVAGAPLSTSTYLGGAADDGALAVAAADDGLVIAGRTSSTNFPTTAGAFQAVCVCTTGNTLSGFVARIDAAATPVEPPAIAGVAALKKPFRLQVSGTGFVTGASVYLGDDASPWPTAQVSSPTLVSIGGGKALKARLPKGVAVEIRVVNPDGGEASAVFTR